MSTASEQSQVSLGLTLTVQVLEPHSANLTCCGPTTLLGLLPSRLLCVFPTAFLAYCVCFLLPFSLTVCVLLPFSLTVCVSYCLSRLLCVSYCLSRLLCVFPTAFLAY